MKLSTNIVKFHQELGLKKTIDVFSAAGFEGIDFNADLQEYYSDAHNLDFYKEIKAYANDKGIHFYQAHAPFRSSFPEEERTQQRFRDIVKSMEHTSLLGTKMLVVHPCKHIVDEEMNTRDFWIDYNLAFYKKLIPYAETYGIKIAIENIHNYITHTPESLLELLDLLDNEVFTVCYDVGHANIAGQDPAEMIKKLGRRIGCTHIHDNNGVDDVHTLPYYGTIDWEAVMKAFAESGYTGNLNYEAARFVTGIPTDFLPEGAKYMANVGRYLIQRFHYHKGNM